MAKIINMRDMSAQMAARVFQAINGGEEKVEIRLHRNDNSSHLISHKKLRPICLTIVTDISPVDLNYPEGWYFSDGCLRNKHYSTNGISSEVYMEKFDGTPWGNFVVCVNVN